jgi:two-component system sensor histidine kinase/response regulator
MSANHIMIVDDNPANLKLLENMLVQQGHEVHSFPLGRLALAAAQRHPPDLILLDINMPEMNGYEVCERLKASENLSPIPVIFLSALNETQDKVKAFQCGGADYIAKPFQFEEVHARVDAHLSVYRLRQALQRQNDQLEQAVAERTRELAQANARLNLLDSSKNDFLRLISHEFRTPLNGILGIGEFLLLSAGADDDELREMFRQSRSRLLALLDDALLLTQIDANSGDFHLRPVSLRAVVERAHTKAAELAEFHKVAIALPAVNGELVHAEESLLERALHALLETAIKFSAEGGSLEIRQTCGTMILISRGKTIPSQLLPGFFETFAIAEAGTAAGDIGLGPALASRILSLFGGSVTVENLSPAGIQITVALHCASLN